MQVEWFRSATVGLYSKAGYAILSDPWLTDGAFIGSWYHFPRLEGHEFDEVSGRQWDAIYVSHLHADHFDRKFMSRIARTQPWCKVIVPSFAHDWLFRAIANCGFPEPNILKIDSGATAVVGDIQVKVFTADHCDPGVCGLSSTCHNSDPRLAAIDSFAIFEADGSRVLNANDALSIASVGNLLNDIGEVDLLLGHYGGAGPFPQCFTDLDEVQKQNSSQALAKVFLRRLAAAATSTNAKYVMPFAGQYVLAGRLSGLNKWRSIVSLTEAVEWLKENSDSVPVAIQPFTAMDIESGKIESAWVEPPAEEIERYIQEISSVRFPYEKKSSNWENPGDDLRDALENVARELRRRAEAGLQYDAHRISIQTTLVSGFIDVEESSTYVYVGPLDEMVSKETRISCHPNLLRGLIVRSDDYVGFTPMHFNQAEIGSHFEWRRKGEYSDALHCLNFLQTGGKEKQLNKQFSSNK